MPVGRTPRILNRMWRGATFLIGMALAAGFAVAASPPDLLEAADHARVVDALACAGIQSSELGFRKDLGEPDDAPTELRALLENPLALTRLGAEALAAAGSADPSAMPALSTRVLEFGTPVLPPASVRTPEWDDPAVDPALRAAVSTFLAGVAPWLQSLGDSRLAPTGAVARAAAGVWDGLFDAEERPATRAALRAAGLPDAMIEQAIADALAVDPQPPADVFRAALVEASPAVLLHGVAPVRELALALHAACAAVRAWPATLQTWSTPFGDIVIGTRGNDVHAGPALLRIDPAGDDLYTAGAAACNGWLGPRVSVCLDLAGRDTYRDDGLPGPGAAVGGILVLLDHAGNDVFDGRFGGSGSALFGAAWVEDFAGDDVHRAGALGQGAAVGGFAVLLDHAGDDVYRVGLSGQGFAGVRGAGWLVDRAGDDTYHAGGLRRDHGRRETHDLTCAQGFAIGMRPLLGGGLGVLADLAGNDTYRADMFGQGGAYWYGAGLLLDAAGDDTYVAYQYAQGSGIHMAAGLLWDGAGNDRYVGWDICQGAAHDYALGFLIDRAGDDTYTANDSSQGMALHNAFGLLLDASGADAYFGRRGETCQGVGHHGGRREYGGLGLLVDGAGRDFYTSGGRDGARWLRPLYGVLYDDDAQP